MTTNREWLHALDLADLTDWFDAEHNDDLAAEKVVIGGAAHSNDGNAHSKVSENLSDAFTDSREKLEAEAFNLFNEWSTLSDDAAAFLTGCVAGFLERQAAITEREYMGRIAELQAELDKARNEREMYRECFGKSVDKADEIRAIMAGMGMK